MSDIDEIHKFNCNCNRRSFLSKSALGLGFAALATLVNPKWLYGNRNDNEGVLGDRLHFVPRAKRVIFLFQKGGPSQHDMFDYKPKLNELQGKPLPPSVRGNQRLTGFTANSPLYLAGTHYDFKQYGKSGAWLSDLLPYTGKIADELCFIKSVHTTEINHDPAIMHLNTGHSLSGHPSMGSWMSYGLGSENFNLPAYSVLSSNDRGQPLHSRMYGSGFLPSQHQGVLYRSGEDPVLYLNNPSGINKMNRRKMLEQIKELNMLHMARSGDSEILSEIAKHEMAFRMQTHAPELVDLSDEPDSVFEMYGEDAREEGTFARNCILARRMAERDVRFIQLFHGGWDQHGRIPERLPEQCKATDQPSAALVKDLKQRGLLDDTLVVWGGEFGRTAYCQGPLTDETYGRDHHPRCFTMWMAGGGVKNGITFGETDEFGYNIIKDPVSVHDLQATVLYLLGIDHKRLTYTHLGRRFRLTDVHGEVVRDILA